LVRQVFPNSRSGLFTAFRWVTRLHAWVPFVAGVALIVFFFILPAYTGAKSTYMSFDYALMGLLAAPLLVGAALLYAVLSIFVRRHHLWAVIVVSVVAVGQGLVVGWCAFCFLAPNSMDAPLLGLVCATYAAALWATGVLGTLVTMERLKDSPGGAGFAVVPLAGPQV
jgi:hypothetical protein